MFLNAIPNRNVFMELPKELGNPTNRVANQVRRVYGTRDAGALCEDNYRDALEAMGYKSGIASPCIFCHLGAISHAWYTEITSRLWVLQMKG